MPRKWFWFYLAFAAILVATGIQAQHSAQLTGEHAAVMKVDEEFRLAKMHNDTSTLERIVSDHYYATNQNRNSRNKEQLIELFRTFPVSPLTTDEFHIRIVDGTAFVTGFQTESGDRMAFMRAYVKNGDAWQLISSIQFHKPR